MAWLTLDLHAEGLGAPPLAHIMMLCKRRRCGLLPPLEMPC